MPTVFQRLNLTAEHRTEAGPHEPNEDTVGVDDEFGLLIVADGMGGGQRGDFASQAAVRTAQAAWRDGLAMGKRTADLMDHVLRAANTAVYQHGRSRGEDLGTTLTVVAFTDDNRLLVGQAGDSHAFLLRGGKVIRLTTEHRAFGNQLKVNIGGRPTLDPFLHACPWQPGDVLLLMTDGLWEKRCSPERIETLSRRVPPDRLGETLMNDRLDQVDDNYSCVSCWDTTAVRTWWQQLAEELAERFRSKPTASLLDELTLAARQAGQPTGVADLLKRAWSESQAPALLALARERLAEDELQPFLLALGEDSEPALLALADLAAARLDTPSVADERLIPLVRRAHRVRPTAATAAYLLSRTDRDSPDFPGLVGHILRESPGPWYEAWTLLCRLAVQGPAGAALCRTVLKQIPRTTSVPGASLLGSAAAEHPLDTLLERIRQEWHEPLARANTAFRESLERLARQVQELQNAKSQIEMRVQEVKQEASQAAQQLARIEDRLRRDKEAANQEWRQGEERLATAVGCVERLERALQQLQHEVQQLSVTPVVVEPSPVERGILEPAAKAPRMKIEATTGQSPRPHGMIRGFCGWAWRHPWWFLMGLIVFVLLAGRIGRLW